MNLLLLTLIRLYKYLRLAASAGGLQVRAHLLGICAEAVSTHGAFKGSQLALQPNVSCAAIPSGAAGFDSRAGGKVTSTKGEA